MTDLGMPGESVFQFDTLLRPEFGSAPQPYYKHMRDTNPAFRAEGAGDEPQVFVARHADIDAALHDPELFSSKFWGPSYKGLPWIPENIDPPDHRKYRVLLDPLFSPRRMNDLEAGITRQIHELIDGFIGNGECDYATQYAVPLPCGVFLRLMGLPLGQTDEYLELKERLLRGTGEMLLSHDEVQQRAYAELSERYEELIGDRRRHPQDDLLTHLVNAEVEGQPLSHEELLGICHLLFIAGLDTVTDTLTCFYAFLAGNPEHRRKIVERPEIIPQAVEEMLRFETPVPFVPRRTTRDTELSGCPIDAGVKVVFLIGSANTDEAAHPRANVVDFDRPGSAHYAFGAGIHRCLGSHLARIELRASLREWHRRIPGYHIPDGTELQYAPLLRQVKHLPLVFDQVVTP
jgi:cytochrome P450